jgi:hypothetical protein
MTLVTDIILGIIIEVGPGERSRKGTLLPMSV